LGFYVPKFNILCGVPPPPPIHCRVVSVYSIYFLLGDRVRGQKYSNRR
jgi:hypothetical protein